MDWSTQFPDIREGLGYYDAEATLVNKGMVLDFYHIPSGFAVAFKGMINSFSDQYASEWNSESVYGRMDPISAFQGTARTISVEWDVVASTVDEAMLNMQKCETLMSMLYPSYAVGEKSNTINASPLFKFKFGNFAHDAGAGYESIGARAKEAGLTGYIGGFTFEPDFDSGIIDGPSDGSLSTSFEPGEFYPQKLTLSAEFTVLHTHNMGWTAGGTDPSWAENLGAGELGQAQAGYPYNSPGSHQSGFEATKGAGSYGASGTGDARSKEAKVTEGTDPGDDMSQVEAFALGLI
jgi:hypothetical protein